MASDIGRFDQASVFLQRSVERATQVRPEQKEQGDRQENEQ